MGTLAFVFTYRGTDRPTGLVCAKPHAYEEQFPLVTYIGLGCGHRTDEGYPVDDLERAYTDYLDGEHSHIGHPETTPDCPTCKHVRWGNRDVALGLHNWRKTFLWLSQRYNGSQLSNERTCAYEAGGNLEALDAAWTEYAEGRLDAESVRQQCLAWADWRANWNTSGVETGVGLEDGTR